jgi:dCMP deaminase
MSIRPDMEAVLMQTAGLMAMRGTCNRLRVGAVLSREGRILSTGYNGNVAGEPHCHHTDDEPCRTAVHAEENVILFAAKYGVSTEGSELFITHAPCYACSRKLLTAGIKRVHFSMEYRSTDGLELLERHGVSIHQT